MRDLLGLQRGQIVGVRLAGASVTKTATLLRVSRTAVSKVVTAYTNHEKTSSAKRNSGRKPKLSERYRVHWRELCPKIVELLHQSWQQKSIFILKTLSQLFTLLCHLLCVHWLRNRLYHWIISRNRTLPIKEPRDWGFSVFFLSCKANFTVKPAKTGHGPHSS
jgi:predicted transcriptional regulator